MSRVHLSLLGERKLDFWRSDVHLDEPSSGAKHVCDYKFLGHNRLMSLQSHVQQKKTKSFGNRRHYQRNTDHGLGNYAATFYHPQTR